MFTFRSLLPIALSLPLLSPDGEGGGSGGGGDDQKPDATADAVEFDEKQQAKVNALIAAERKRTEEATATRLKAERDEADRKSKAEADRKKQEEAGQFEDVRKSLETERDTAATERDGYKTRIETLEALAADRLKALMADIPKEIAGLGPSDDTPIEQKLAWAEKAAKAAGVTKTARGNGFDPKPGANDKIDERQEVQKIRSRIPSF